MTGDCHRTKKLYGSKRSFIRHIAVVVLISAFLWPTTSHGQRKQCVDCHEDFKNKNKLDFVHEPLKDCETCHKRHGFSQKLVLVKSMPGLCVECHEGVASEIEGDNVHGALSEGSCTVCHDPHASDLSGLMRATEGNLPACILCHTGFAETMAGDNIHDPVAKANCAVCHEPHSSDRPSLLVSDESSLCESCHDNALSKHKMPGASDFGCGDCHDPHGATKKSPIAGYAHDPFASGDCEDCHSIEDGEVAIEDDFPPADLCETCHDDVTGLIGGATSHFGTDPIAAGGTSTCLQCHEYHTGRIDGLLTDHQFQLCSKCHENLGTPATQRAAFHAPYVRGECTSCHEPHGGGTGSLLAGEPNAVCASCHEDITALMTQGPASHEALELVDCIECHEPHLAPNMALLKGRPEEACFSCHEKMAFSNPHEPYSTSSCGTCHRNHATSPGLLAADTNVICKACHAQQFNSLSARFSHTPAQDETCVFCHSPHGSDNKNLLNESQSVLCFDCHDMDDLTLAAASAEDTEPIHLHAPVAEGDCGGCHDPHGSTLENLLTREKEVLCYGCHTQEKITFASGAVHKPVADGDCYACHTPHGGPGESLRALPEPQLCVKCHDFTVPPLQGSHLGFEVAETRCTTCHDPHNSPGDHLLNAVAHEPFQDQDCESCHEDGTSAAVAFEADMCYMCHDDVESGTGHQHSADVKCIDCHSPHTSRFEALLHNPVRLCRDCHQDVLQIASSEGKEITLHKPLADGACLDCHKLHNPPSPGFLVNDQLALCSSCHASIEERTSDASQHKPFGEGKCSSCHSTHVAVEAHMLKKDERRLCKSCHRISTDEMAKSHGNIPLSGENCTTCHDPHSTPKAGSVLVYANLHSPYEDGDCSACHEDDGSVQGRIDVCFDCHDGEDYNTVHVAGRSGDDLASVEVCLDCHSPHAGHENIFRRGSDIETCLQCHDRKEFERENVHAALDEGCAVCHDLHQNNYSDLMNAPVNELCGTCHEDAGSHAHPLGSEYKDPRNGRPLTCASCHEPHSSDHEYILTFDQSRDLCVQCHASGTMRAH